MTHVLAVRLDNDGDVLLTGPALRAIAAGADAGARRITLLCGPRGRRAARVLPHVDAVIEHRAEWIDPEPPPLDWPGTLALIDQLATLDVDQAIVFTSFHQSALPTAMLLRAAGVPVVAAISEDYPGSLLDVRHRVSDDIHEVERSLSLVATLGYTLAPHDDGRLGASVDLDDLPADLRGRRYVVVHPGASVPARAWAPERNAELVTALADEGTTVVVTGGPDEVKLTAHVAGSPRPEVVDLGGKTTFEQLAAVLAAADAIVVGNTGPAHLAAAVNTPVVSLFAPTVPAVRWRPWKVAHELLYVDVPCAGCRAKVCPVDGHPCLSGVSVAAAVAALRRLAPANQPAGALP